MKAVFLYARSMLAIYILAVDPFPDNAKLREVIAGFTSDCWEENPHLKGTDLSEQEIRTVSQRIPLTCLFIFPAVHSIHWRRSGRAG